MTRALILALAIVNFQSPAPAPTPTPSPKALTVSGCVADDTANPSRYLFTDSDGSTYRLSGTDVRHYVGRRVQLTGSVVDSKRLHIGGGLVPSANVAGQAGAMDPAQAAMAAATPSGSRPPMQTFRVTRVKTVAGTCPEK
jgi:hypothetical protein